MKKRDSARKGDEMNEVKHIGLSLLGYNRNQVERILEKSETRVSELEQKLTAVTTELDKVRQELSKYMEMEQALKDGIIDARIAGNKIKEESSEEARRLAERTNEQVNQFKSDFSTYSFDLIANGERVKQQMQKMKEELLAMLERYQNIVTEMDFDAIYPEQETKLFSSRVDAFVSENDQIVVQAERPYEPAMTDSEKETLQQLISDVIEAEHSGHVEPEQKLVPFVPKAKQAKAQA